METICPAFSCSPYPIVGKLYNCEVEDNPNGAIALIGPAVFLLSA